MRSIELGCAIAHLRIEIPGLVLAHHPGMTKGQHHHARTATRLRSAVQHHPLQPCRCSTSPTSKLSRDFYETTVGLHVEDADDNCGLSARQRGASASFAGAAQGARRRPATGSASRSAMTTTSTRPRSFSPTTASPTPSPSSRSRAAPCSSPIPSATASNSTPRWTSARICCRRYDLYKGCHPQRLDHFNVFAAEVQDTVDFYARLGFRLTEYAEEDGAERTDRRGLAASQGQRA